MKKSIFPKFLSVALALFILSLVLTSCGLSSNGKKELIGTMFRGYTADAEYLFEVDGQSVAGTACITKDENIRIDITAPEPYTGICILSDANDSASIISISYSGIKADVPKSALDKLSLVLTIFGDTALDAIDKAPSKSFVRCEETYSLEGLGDTEPYEVGFSVGDIDYIYVYDSVTGAPIDLVAKSGGNAVEIKIRKLKTAQ